MKYFVRFHKDCKIVVVFYFMIENVCNFTVKISTVSRITNNGKHGILSLG